MLVSELIPRRWRGKLPYFSQLGSFVQYALLIRSAGSQEDLSFCDFSRSDTVVRTLSKAAVCPSLGCKEDLLLLFPSDDDDAEVHVDGPSLHRLAVASESPRFICSAPLSNNAKVTLAQEASSCIAVLVPGEKKSWCLTI